MLGMEEIILDKCLKVYLLLRLGFRVFLIIGSRSSTDLPKVDDTATGYPLIVLRKYQYFGTTRWLKQCCVPPRPLQSTSYEHFHCLPNS